MFPMHKAYNREAFGLRVLACISASPKDGGQAGAPTGAHGSCDLPTLPQGVVSAQARLQLIITQNTCTPGPYQTYNLTLSTLSS